MSPTASALLMIACCPAFGQHTPSQDFTLRVNSDLVVLEAGVTDPRGANVPDLKLADFRVYEDGRLQTIRQFSAEERPATIALVVDNSGSMRPKRPEVITAALGMIEASNPDDEVFVVNFNDSATLGLPPEMPFSGDIAELRRALSIGRAQGRTALNDAMILAIEHLAQGKWDKKALLLVSDGGDNSSQHTSKDVLAAIEHAQAIVYTIGLFDPEDPDRNPGALRRLTDISGGKAYLPERTDEIVGICQSIAHDIRSRYTLAYVPSAESHPGVVHRIKVVARSDSGTKLLVRTRTSYAIRPDSTAALEDRTPPAH